MRGGGSVLVAYPVGGLRWARLGPLERAVTRVRAHRLDEMLAHGRSAEATTWLAWHAQRITTPAYCHRLARTFDELADRAACEPAHISPRILPRPERLRPVAADLRAVAERLRMPGPISSNGVATARLLLTEAGSPLYRPGRWDLEESLRTTLCALG